MKWCSSYFYRPIRAAACCACLLLIGCPGCGSSSAPHGHVDGGATRAEFAVLRSPPEHLPGTLARHIARLLKASERAKPVITQLARTRGGSIWILLTEKELCLAQADFGSVSCKPKRAARSRGVVLGTFDPPSRAKPYLHRFLVLGVMPDGVKYVSATIGRHLHERHIKVSVQDNVFAIAAEQPVLVRGLVRP